MAFEFVFEARPSVRDRRQREVNNLSCPGELEIGAIGFGRIDFVLRPAMAHVPVEDKIRWYLEAPKNHDCSIDIRFPAGWDQGHSTPNPLLGQNLSELPERARLAHSLDDYHGICEEPFTDNRSHHGIRADAKAICSELLRLAASDL